MRHFNDSIKGMCFQRDAGRILTEPYSGLVSETFKTSDYTPTYEVGSDGFTCSCSRNSRLGVCRHQIFHRYTAAARSHLPIKIFCLRMVNQTLLQIRHRNTELEETDMILTPADRPESPDLVLDVDEPSDNTEAAGSAISTTSITEPPPNIKYNEVLDKCVLTAELVSQYSGEEYKKRLSAVDKLNKYLRDGFPTNLLHALNHPDDFSIHPVSQVAENDPHLHQLPMSPQPLPDQELSVFCLPYPVRPVNESQPPYCQDTYEDDEYMFPANIFDTPSSPKCPTQPHTSSPLEGLNSTQQ